MGYHRSGFEVIGVDIRPQPSYPFPFVQADALEPPVDLSRFDLIHASPPCQAFSTSTADRSRHPDLIAPTRALLEESGRPYVIENVQGAPLSGYLRLCGSMFGMDIQRHRYFEITFPAWSPGGCNHKAWKTGRARTVTGHAAGQIGQFNRHSRKYADLDEARELMGMAWPQTTAEIVEAIPPAYTEWIGRQFMHNHAAV